MSRSIRLVGFFVAIVGAAGLRPAVAADPAPADVAGRAAEALADEGTSEQQRLDKEFAAMLSGATLSGRFTAGTLEAAPCKDCKDSSGATENKDEPAPKSSDESAGGDGPAKKAAPATTLKEDRYTLGRVQKMQGDLWLIEARIQYGDHDVTVPLVLKVKWAGDTPVITLTDFTVPGLGTFTARVLFYRGQYAGTWSHGNHGGELFGKVLPAKH